MAAPQCFLGLRIQATKGVWLKGLKKPPLHRGWWAPGSWFDLWPEKVDPISLVVMGSCSQCFSAKCKPHTGEGLWEYS